MNSSIKHLNGNTNEEEKYKRHISQKLTVAVKQNVERLKSLFCKHGKSKIKMKRK